MINIRQDGYAFDDVLLIPQKNNIISRKYVDLTTQITKKIKINIPIVSANMDTVTESNMAISIAKIGGVGVIHRFLSIDDQVEKVVNVKKLNLIVGAAIGVQDDDYKRLDALVKNKTDFIVIDIAHGHSTYLIDMVKKIKKKYPKLELIGGNIATKQAAKDLINAGVSGLKVGIGPGALCSTRIIAGAGVPQLTAIIDVVSIAKNFHIPVIADGGIRHSGDAVKALAAGASTVMLGTLLAGCAESPAITIYKNGQKYKLTRGMASITANYERMYKDNFLGSKSIKNLKEYAAEGVEAIVPYKGSVIEFITQFANGIRSGFTYCGAKNIHELWKKAKFIKISRNALIESHPHDIGY